MMEEVPREPQVPQPSGIPKISAQKPHSKSSTHVYNTICIGFGNIGLGLAVALSDLTIDTLDNVLFLERSPRFTSPRERSQSQYIQTTFAQDLATLRCPTSPFTFLNYLSEHHRLESFLASSQSLNPTSKDFEGYLEWAAGQFGDVVMYGEQVVKVEVVDKKAASGKLWVVTIKNVQTAKLRTVVCKNVVLATGTEARIVRMHSQLDSDGENAGNIIDQMREFCSSGYGGNSDQVFSSLAINSGRTAATLLFESEGNATRATL